MAAIVCGLVLSIASAVTVVAQEIPRARQRWTPITVPIGCLMAAACLNGGGLETMRKTGPVTLAESADPRLPVYSITSSEARVFGIDDADAAARADKLLEEVREEWLKLPRSKLLDRGPSPTGEHIIGPPPHSLQARLVDYAQGDDFFACTLVFETMRRANANINDNRLRSGVLWDLYKRYIDNCHKGTIADLGKARDRIVIFVRKDLRDNYYIYCLGFNFAANYILTAHHCLVEPDEIQLMVDRFKPTDPDAFIEVDAPSPRSRALVLGEPSKSYLLKIPLNLQQNLNFYPFERERDSVVLELDAPDRTGIDSFPIGRPNQWDRIAIPALFVDDSAISDPIKHGQGDILSAAIDDGSAIDISPLCSLVYSNTSKAPFVYHGCQTRYGYSGGPILRLANDGTTVLVGVHTGSVDLAHPIDGWPYGALFPNYGLTLPPLVDAAVATPRP
jgi:hypothetical protein